MHARGFRRKLRLTSAFAAGLAVAMSLLAAPTLANGDTATLWVDDDGHAGPSRCRGSASAFTSVQAAVNSSDIADRILVCPGRYVGSVQIVGRDRLVLQSVVPREARIVAPTGINGGVLVDIINTDYVQVRGFTLAAPTAQPCSRVGIMLQSRAGSHGTLFRNNLVTARGANTIGPCGYTHGIQITQGSGVIEGNVVRDFQSVAIFGTHARVRVIDNSLRYYHVRENPGDVAGVGIRIDVASGVVLRNDDIGLMSAGSTTPRPQEGIAVTNVTDDLQVRNNVVRRNFFGIHLHGSSGVLVVNNVSRNFISDCQDDSTGNTGTDGTDNIWLDNVGDPAKSNPSTICSLP